MYTILYQKFGGSGKLKQDIFLSLYEYNFLFWRSLKDGNYKNVLESINKIILCGFYSINVMISGKKY